MFYNRLKAVLFLSILLISKVGMALNVHYCGGKIAEIAFAWNAEGCGMSSDKSQETERSTTTIKNHCCQDEIVFLQNNEPLKENHTVFQLFSYAVENNFDFYFQPTTSRAQWIKKYPEFLFCKNKIYLLHQSFVFYG
ncbi:MAG: hypothetical protein CMC93_02375 [Flavobacteriaceae bacterium]|nr:hypothetical protein [Flavobacteriaceae bacterium]|tara:strand:- start:288 stop:698 length:411 start_codon:yes stop_codon:yes gene_type:complete